MSCSGILSPTLAEFTLPEAGLYKVSAYATAQSTGAAQATEVLGIGFKYGSNYYTLDTSTFSSINRAFANGEYTFYAEAGSKISAAVWTSGTPISVDAASISIQYMGA